MNITIAVPPGTTDHGSPGLLCKPPKWTDFIAFYATNYFAHAATIMSEPGTSTWEVFSQTAMALFIPGFGIVRVMRRLLAFPILERKDHVRRAMRAGALCMVVKRAK